MIDFSKIPNGGCPFTIRVWPSARIPDDFPIDDLRGSVAVLGQTHWRTISELASVTRWLDNIDRDDDDPRTVHAFYHTGGFLSIEVAENAA